MRSSDHCRAAGPLAQAHRIDAADAGQALEPQAPALAQFRLGGGPKFVFGARRCWQPSTPCARRDLLWRLRPACTSIVGSQINDIGRCLKTPCRKPVRSTGSCPASVLARVTSTWAAASQSNYDGSRTATAASPTTRWAELSPTMWWPPCASGCEPHGIPTAHPGGSETGRANRQPFSVLVFECSVLARSVAGCQPLSEGEPLIVRNLRDTLSAIEAGAEASSGDLPAQEGLERRDQVSSTSLFSAFRLGY